DPRGRSESERRRQRGGGHSAPSRLLRDRHRLTAPQTGRARGAAGVELCRDVYVLCVGHGVLLVTVAARIGDLDKTSQRRGDLDSLLKRVVQPESSAPSRRSSSARSTALAVSAIAPSYAPAAAYA